MQLCTARLHPKGTSPRCALRAPRLLRSLAMTNLGVLSSRVIARRAQARRGNLKQAVTNPPEAFLCSGRCCEITTAPLGPRNDKSRAFTVLTIGCQFRRYSAGSGVPLPYNITSHCKRAGRAVRPFSILLFHFHSAEDIDGAHAYAEVPALGIGVKIQVDLVALDAAADVLGHAVAIDILAVV